MKDFSFHFGIPPPSLSLSPSSLSLSQLEATAICKWPNREAHVAINYTLRPTARNVSDSDTESDAYPPAQTESWEEYSPGWQATWLHPYERPQAKTNQLSHSRILNPQMCVREEMSVEWGNLLGNNRYVMHSPIVFYKYSIITKMKI